MQHIGVQVANIYSESQIDAFASSGQAAPDCDGQMWAVIS